MVSSGFNMNTRKNNLLLAIASLAIASQAQASEVVDTCSDLLKECFAHHGLERDGCLRSASEHPSCSKTRAGSLAAMRSQFSPLKPEGSNVGPSFLGVQIIDANCISNFDNIWSGALIKGSATKEAYSELEAELQGCARAPAPDIMRP